MEGESADCLSPVAALRELDAKPCVACLSVGESVSGVAGGVLGTAEGWTEGEARMVSSSCVSCKLGAARDNGNAPLCTCSRTIIKSSSDNDFSLVKTSLCLHGKSIMQIAEHAWSHAGKWTQPWLSAVGVDDQRC